MTAKEYLNQLYDLKQKIRDNENEIKEIKARATSLGVKDFSRDVVKSSQKTYATYEDAINKAILLEQKIAAENCEFIDVEQQIKAEIEQLKNTNERSILRMRYILFMSWTDIAETMMYSYRHIIRLHGQALQNFSKLYGFPKE